MKIMKLAAAVLAAVMAMGAAPVVDADDGWEWKNIGCMGDLDGDRELTQKDLALLSDHLLGKNELTLKNAYKVGDSFIGINGADGFQPGEYLITADINQDGAIDTYDLALMRQEINDNSPLMVWKWQYTQRESPGIKPPENFIYPSVYELYGSMPSQNSGRLLIFYVDFPDCKYTYEPTEAELDKIAFGEKDMMNSNYPFESIRAFMKRSSENVMDLSGRSYRYRTIHEKSFYEGDKWHVALIDEIIEGFRNKIDFSSFDGDNDKSVDSILISVPNAAGDDDWWPKAGVYGGKKDMIDDEMYLDHIIVGNSEVKSATDHSDFVSSYCHELGHCMGLPDYYTYTKNELGDYQGMHGSAGFELMDDANCDFGALSKLMLGWYNTWSVYVWDPRDADYEIPLFNAQADRGNCIIIPGKDFDDENYRSEFFIIEYTTLKGNNTALKKQWWRRTGEGIRIYHVSAELNDNYRYRSWKYVSGNDAATDYDKGRRFIRLVGEGDDMTDNLFHDGDVIDSSTPGFAWYGPDGKEDQPVGVKINVMADEGSYLLTIVPE